MRIVKEKNRRLWDLAGLAAWLLLCYLTAAFGSQFSPGIWYEQLEKPPWQPPDWVFGPVWIVLYTMMGVAAWLVWRSRGFFHASIPLVLFITQLIFNAAWSWIFFGLQQPGFALLEISLLWILIAATLVAFWQERPIAGVILVPYLIWVSYATTLNFEIWRLNP